MGCEEDTAPVPGTMDVIPFFDPPPPTPDELNNKSVMFPLFKMNIVHFRGECMAEMEMSIFDFDISPSPYCIDRVGPFLVDVG